MKMQITKWISTKSAFKKPLSVKTPPQEQHGGRIDSFTGFTFQMDRDEVEDKMRKEDMPLDISSGGDSAHSQEQYLDSFAVETKEQHNVVLRMQSEIHEETVEDKQTELETNINDIIRVENEILSLKEMEGNLREQVTNAMKNMDENNQAVKRIISEINEWQRHRPEIKTELENHIGGSETMDKRVFGHFRNIEYKESTKRSTIVFEYEEQMQEDETALRPDVTTETDIRSQSADLREHLTTRAEEMGYSSTIIQRLKEEIHKTKEMVVL